MTTPPLPTLDVQSNLLHTPSCHGMQELPTAHFERRRIAKYLSLIPPENPSSPIAENDATTAPVDPSSPLFHHLTHGLALTIGSALGETPPSTSQCLEAFLVPNKVHLTAGARAWSKHAHRALPPPTPGPEVEAEGDSATRKKGKKTESGGWWGTPSGPVKVINENALKLFWRIMENATWKNLHWLPHQVLVYEARVKEGYGMRWSQDRSQPVPADGDDSPIDFADKPWVFRGFVEPMMENGHEVGWRHPS